MQGAHKQAGPRQGTARPGHMQWPAMDTAALGQAVRAMNAVEPGLMAGG